MSGPSTTTELGKLYLYSTPTTLVRYTGPTGGGTPPPPPTAWDLSQVVSQARPSGAGYVTYESLFVTGDNLQSVAAKVPADGSGNPQILTLPAGVFEVVGFNDGNYDGLRLGSGGNATHCKGIIGSGNGPSDTIIRSKANSATRKQPGTQNMPTGTGIAGTVIRCEGQAGARFSNFRMEGQSMTFTDGTELYYTGLMIGSCPDSEFSWIKGYGMSRGCGNEPSPETFGINVYKSDRTVIRDSIIDGRLSGTSTRWGASPFGWNGSGQQTTEYPGQPVLDAKVYRVWTGYSIAGMPTWWQTYGIETEDLWSIGNGSGSGILQGHAINHEQSWGRIRHTRPVLHAKATSGFEPDRSANSGFHCSLLSDSHDTAADFLMIDPDWDSNYQPPSLANSMLMFWISTKYKVPSNDPTRNNVVAAVPKVIKNGVQLGQRTQWVNSDWHSADKTQFFGVGRGGTSISG